MDEGIAEINKKLFPINNIYWKCLFPDRLHPFGDINTYISPSPKKNF